MGLARTICFFLNMYYIKPYTNNKAIMKSIHLIKPYFVENRYRILAGLACLIAVDLLQLFIPRVIKWAVDAMLLASIDAAGLFTYAFYITGLAVVAALLRYVWRLCLIGTSRRVEEGLRNRLFAHIQTLSASYFDKTKTGDIMAHATNDLNHIRMAFGMGMVALNDAVVLGSAAVGFMLYIHVTLTLYVLIPMPLIVFSARLFSKKMHRRYRDVQGAFSKLTEAVRERMTGIRIIKAYGMESSMEKELDAISADYVGKNLRLVRITGTFIPMMIMFSNISLALVLFIGGRQTVFAAITPGDFVAFISYLGLLTWPMMAMGWVTNLIQRGRASLERIDNILQTRPEISDPASAGSKMRGKGDLVFSHVTFAYANAAAPALKDLDFRLRPGQMMGVVGPPGSGKTSLLKLIPRLYDVSSGAIRLDGTDIRQFRLHDLRTRMSFVPQEPFLFAGTIEENLTFGNPAITRLQLTEAAAKASFDDTVASFKNGYETVIGEKGVLLSGGQKQRLALARALLHFTPLLILDDPISQVDVETGQTIIQTIRSMAQNRSMIITSHRLSALTFADTIIVLDQGRIAASGNHTSLMADSRYYAATYGLQELEKARDAN
jgi:ATP-binding cassette subfamily B multidrug efflux pump